MEFKTICTFQLPHNAHLAKSKLESEGIEAIFKDEFTVQTHNFLSNAIGGIKIQVRKDDVLKATKILNESGYNVDKNTIKLNPLLSRLESFSNTHIIIFVFVTIGLVSLILGTIWSDELIKAPKVESPPPLYHLDYSIYDSYIELIKSDPNLVIKEVSHIIEDKPNCVLCYEILGHTYLSLDSFSLALDSFNKQISIGLEGTKALDNLIKCYFGLKQYDNVIIQLEKASKIDSWYLHNLAYMYAVNKQYNESILTYEKHLIDPGHRPYGKDSLIIVEEIDRLKNLLTSSSK